MLYGSKSHVPMFVGGMLVALVLMTATAGFTAWLATKAKTKQDVQWQAFAEENQCKLVEVDLHHGFWRNKRSTYICDDGVRYSR